MTWVCTREVCWPSEWPRVACEDEKLYSTDVLLFGETWTPDSSDSFVLFVLGSACPTLLLSRQVDPRPNHLGILADQAIAQLEHNQPTIYLWMFKRIVFDHLKTAFRFICFFTYIACIVGSTKNELRRTIISRTYIWYV